MDSTVTGVCFTDDSLLQQEIADYKTRTTKSFMLHQEALKTIPGGVSSCYQCMDPYPFFVEKGEQNSIVDVDGNRLLDFHGGFGVTLFGYKHPLIQAATATALEQQGFLVSLPSKTMVTVSQKLADRFKMPFWRFLNSGTEATLDAIRLGRARHNRPYCIKIESGYHGHHDAVWVSVHAGAREDYAEASSDPIPSTPFCQGIPESVFNLTLIAEFNNIDSVRALLDKYYGQVGSLIVEPVLLNCSMIKPQNGFLQSVIELCRQHDVAVIFDLVKINTAIAHKQITAFWDSEKCGPDMYTFGKGLSGGSCPIGAIGMTEEFARIIESKRVQVSGTYSGNTYAMSMVDVVQNFITDESQATLEAMSKYMRDKCQEIILAANLPAVVDYIGNKGCITFFKKGVTVAPVKNYQHYVQNVDIVVETMFSFFCFNRGLWVQPRDEWSLSYQHTMADAERFVETFRLFAELIKNRY